MSLFDPHGLYRKTYYYTNKGQIIRQKDIDRPGIIKKSEIPRSIQVLQTYGYTIYAPGEEPAHRLKEEYQIATFTKRYNLDSEHDSFSFSLSNIWPSISSSFRDILAYNPSDVTVNYISFGLTSLFWFLSVDQNTDVQPLFYNNSDLFEFPARSFTIATTSCASFTRSEGYIISPIGNSSAFSSIPSGNLPNQFISFFRADDSYEELKDSLIVDDHFFCDLQLTNYLRSSTNYVILNFSVYISILVPDE